MEPSEQYLKSKRNLVLFSGLLLLSTTVGLNVASEDKGSSLLPISLSDVTYFDEVILLLVVYFTFQLTLFWFAHGVAVRQLMHYRIDFYSSITIAGFSLLAYAYSAIVSLSEAYVVSWSPQDGWALIGAAVAVLAVLTSMLSSVKRLSSLTKQKRERVEQDIINALTGLRWFLVFNPRPPGRGKEIAFREDGSIDVGSNDNEHRWQIRNGLLEILNKEGQIFSRFIYDKDHMVFRHTNDEDTLSLRSQRIELLNGAAPSSQKETT